MTTDKPYCPPKPYSLWAVPALFRTLWRGEGNLLELLPAAAYKFKVGNLGISRRSTVLFNDPELVNHILRDPEEIFPKSDLMVSAVEPLIGQSIFVTDGEKWRKQRAMVDPAFSMMRISHAFSQMQEAVNDHETELEGRAKSGEEYSLDQAMGQLTADIICRAVFSTSLDSNIAHDVFEDFNLFERHVAQTDIMHMITAPAWSNPPQKPEVLDACARIRQHLGTLVDTHLDPESNYNDIASEVVSARDKDTGEAFSRDELIDQLGVFFLAGHETTASVLTWVFYILASQPNLVRRLRQEINDVVGDGEVEFAHIKRLPLVRAVFRETLRLYPPITFIPRVALRNAKVGPRKLRRGALVMIAPWTLHRHKLYWKDPHVFRPERFLSEQGEQTPGAYIPFGQGNHTCVGAGFAQAESALIISRLIRRFDFLMTNTEPVRPAARLTTRPVKQITYKVKFSC